jgi:hypothetical protein
MQKRRWIALATLCALIVMGSILWLTRDQSPASQPDPAPAQDAGAPEALPALSGRVIGFDGASIGGALVRAGEAEVTADASGRFAFAALAPGELVVDASAPGWISPGPATLRGRRVEIDPGSPASGVELVMRRPGAIRGRVVGPQGQAISGAKLGLHYVFADGVGGPLEAFALDDVAQTGPDGTFALEGISPGRVRVLVDASGFALATGREVFLRDGQSFDGLTISVGEAHTLALTVLSTEGELVPDVRVSLRGPGIMGSALLKLDERGQVSRAGLGEGMFVVEASAPGYAIERADVEVVAGEARIERDLVLEPATGMSARVEDAQGRAVGDAVVQLTCANGQAGRYWSDPTGLFNADIAGVCDAQAYAITGSPSPKVSLREGVPGVIRLGAGATLVGRVVDRSGRPVPAYQLNVESFTAAEGPPLYHSSAFPAKQINRADGRFELGPLIPGEFVLRAAPSGMAHATSAPVRVSAGQRSGEIQIVVDAGGVVSGVVRGDDGKPIAGARVEVLDAEGRAQHGSAMTDTSGRYQVSGVAAGRRAVRASAQGFLTQLEGGVTVVSERTVSRDIRMAAASPDARFAFHGVGAVLRQEGDAILIQQLVEGSPAAAYGLKQNDRIMAVDGEATGGMALAQIVDRIRGEEGAPVRVEVEREGEGRVVVEVTRGRVVVRDDLNVGDR